METNNNAILETVNVKESEAPEKRIDEKELRYAQMGNIFGAINDDFAELTTVAQSTNVMTMEVQKHCYVLFGRVLTQEEIFKIHERMKDVKDLDGMNENEINDFLATMDLKLNKNVINTDAIVGGLTQTQLLVSFLTSISDMYTMNETFKAALESKETIKEALYDDMDELMSEVDLTKKMGEIKEKLDATEDPIAKERLFQVYNGMYTSVKLNIILSKIQHKGAKQILKESKKDLNKAEIKFLKAICKDKRSYLNAQYLRPTLYQLYPENRTEIDAILYMIYKHVTKRSEIDGVNAEFINYFILNVSKMYNNLSAKKKEHYQLDDSIKKAISMLNK